MCNGIRGTLPPADIQHKSPPHGTGFSHGLSCSKPYSRKVGRPRTASPMDLAVRSWSRGRSPAICLSPRAVAFAVSAIRAIRIRTPYTASAAGTARCLAFRLATFRKSSDRGSVRHLRPRLHGFGVGVYLRADIFLGGLNATASSKRQRKTGHNKHLQLSHAGFFPGADGTDWRSGRDGV